MKQTFTADVWKQDIKKSPALKQSGFEHLKTTPENPDFRQYQFSGVKFLYIYCINVLR